MLNYFNLLSKVAEGDDDAVIALLKKGTLESFSETSNGVFVDTIYFTDKVTKEKYSHRTFDLDRSKEIKKDSKKINTAGPGHVSMKNGSTFVADTWQQGIKILIILKNKYEEILNKELKNENYSSVNRCKEAIDEIDETIEIYERKKGQDPEGGSISMGEI